MGCSSVEVAALSAPMAVHPGTAASPGTSADQPTVRAGAKIELAYQRLKQDIMSGAYSQNERLVEAPLTRALGVSRNTLRTVLARLEHDGLVVLEPNRGGRVRAFSREEAHDMLRVREVLEGLVARLAAGQATPEQLACLHAIVAETEQAVSADDVMRTSALNRRFHEHLIAAAGSPQAAAALDSLRFPLAKFQFQVALVPGRKVDNLQEHQELLRAIKAHDADGAERVGRQHIRQIQATLEQLGPTTSF
jgi:DNA-binding GntR family transcriptional regulator